MIDLDEDLNCLLCTRKCLNYFFHKEHIETLNSNKTSLYFSEGQVIAKQSSFASKIIFLQSGVTKMVKEGKNGKNTVIKLDRENNFLDVPIHDTQKKYSYTTIALTDVLVCEINESALHSFIAGNTGFIDFLLEKYHTDELFMINRLHLINTRNNHGKLAASLLYLSSFQFNGNSIFDFVSRKDLAELSSISIESVNKILQELKNDRIIELTNKGIRINKLDLIEKLSQVG